MRIRLGVVGPSDSVELVKNAAKGFSKIDIIPFAYKQIEETSDIILQNKPYVDQWLFSGQAPYHYALSNRLIRKD
jgi:hypothetical protein